jgi:uncharacterized repeat protein (TIGR01451 family)
LSIDKVDDPDPVSPGQALTYTITVSNAGPDGATGVMVDDTLSADVTLDSVSSSQGGCSSLPCNLGAIASGGDATVEVVVTVDPAAASPLENSAEVTSSSDDPNLANNTITISTTVTTDAEADLSIAKVADPDPVAPGQALTYTITVSNAGPDDAHGVYVTDFLPGGVTLVSVTPSQGSCTDFPCTLGTIASGDAASIEAVVTVGTNATDPLENTAEVSSVTDDPVLSNNSVTIETQVVHRLYLPLVSNNYLAAP